MTILQLKDENRTLSSLPTQEHSVSLTIHTVCSHLEALKKEVYGIKVVSTDTASTIEAIRHAVVTGDRERNLLKHRRAEFETADILDVYSFVSFREAAADVPQMKTEAERQLATFSRTAATHTLCERLANSLTKPETSLTADHRANIIRGFWSALASRRLYNSNLINGENIYVSYLFKYT